MHFMYIVLLLLARLMGQYFLLTGVCRRLSTVIVCQREAGCVGGRLLPGRPPGTWVIGRLTLHGGSVRLRPVRATPCYNCLGDI